jgi:hypothetical protein
VEILRVIRNVCKNRKHLTKINSVLGQPPSKCNKRLRIWFA